MGRNQSYRKTRWPGAQNLDDVARRFTDVKGLLSCAKPAAGDHVLASVEMIGQHNWLEEHLGRSARLDPDNEIIVAYGARYAPDHFEADVLVDLAPHELVAGGGGERDGADPARYGAGFPKSKQA